MKCSFIAFWLLCQSPLLVLYLPVEHMAIVLVVDWLIIGLEPRSIHIDALALYFLFSYLLLFLLVGTWHLVVWDLWVDIWHTFCRWLFSLYIYIYRCYDLWSTIIIFKFMTWMCCWMIWPIWEWFMAIR